MTSTFSSVELSARYPRVVVTRACEPLDCPAASVAAVVEVVELVVVVVVVAAAAVAAAAAVRHVRFGRERPRRRDRTRGVAAADGRRTT